MPVLYVYCSCRRAACSVSPAVLLAAPSSNQFERPSHKMINRQPGELHSLLALTWMLARQYKCTKAWVRRVRLDTRVHSFSQFYGLPACECEPLALACLHPYQ